ncbi:MAG: 2OG-Fe(II) oxygenase [Legionella sp.]
MLNQELLTHELCTKGFYICDEFLQPADYQALRLQAEDLYAKGLFRSARIGRNLHNQRNEQIRSDEICWLEEDTGNQALAAYLEQTTLIATQLNQELFLSLAEFETHFALYQPGTFYKKHLDQFAATKTRKISCVYYLNDDWQASWGGQLILYNREDEVLAEVNPQGNRFICFNSELPHEVKQTNSARYSLTGWMKTRA